MSTLFCTAHLRGFSASLYSAIADRKGEELKKSLYHGGLIMTFLAGGISCSLISKSLGGYTIALSSLPLLFVLQEVLRKETGLDRETVVKQAAADYLRIMENNGKGN